jgi:hypothetical protein
MGASSSGSPSPSPSPQNPVAAPGPNGCRRQVLCEHLFMTSQGSPYGRFRRALDNGNALAALSATAELRSVSLTDALELCLLLCEREPRRYERAALRVARAPLPRGRGREPGRGEVRRECRRRSRLGFFALALSSFRSAIPLSPICRSQSRCGNAVSSLLRT